jgi:hypothetical protein
VDAQTLRYNVKFRICDWRSGLLGSRFRRLSCSNPSIHRADHELPQAANFVSRQLLPLNPLVDHVGIDAQVIRNFRTDNQRSFMF